MFGCEDTAGSGENDDLPEILSLTFVQSTPCNSRYGASAVSYENEIYLIGGTNYPTYFTTIEKLDETNNQWTELNEQVIGRSKILTDVGKSNALASIWEKHRTGRSKATDKPANL